MISNENIEGATPIDPDELSGLQFKHISHREQLNELEQANMVMVDSPAYMQTLLPKSIFTYCPLIGEEKTYIK